MQTYPITLRPARHGNMSTLPTKIIFVDEKYIGTHEGIRGHNLLLVLKSILRRGYSGPPIAVIEHGRDHIYQSDKIAPFSYVELIKHGQVGVADGHHRITALRILSSLSLLNLSIIPVQIIPARDSSVVKIAVNKQKENIITLADIEKCFPVPEKIMLPSTTTFKVKLSTDEWVRLRDGQPDVLIPPTQLFNYQKLRQLKENFILSPLQEEQVKPYVGTTHLENVFLEI